MVSLRYRERLGELIRFGIVGILATMIHYGIYLVLRYAFSSLNVSLCYSIGYIISFIANFFASNYFTFRTQPTARKGIGFVICHGVNYLLHLFFLNLFIWCGLHDVFAPIPTFCIVIPINFILVRFVLKR